MKRAHARLAALPDAVADTAPPPADEARGPVALRVDGLRRTYGAVEAVAGISFDVRCGEVFGLLGPNGAGKTTTISVIATQLRPSAGKAAIFGHQATGASRAVRSLIGVVPQEISLYPKLSAAENIRFFGRMYGVPREELGRRVNELLALVGLEGRRDDYVGTFSGGMQRRLNLAVSLVHQPRLLLLDEPTVGVDPHSRERLFQVIESLRDRGTAVLYTTHYMEEAERLCNRIGIMDEGRIIAMGPLDRLLTEAGCAEVITVHGLPPGAALGRLGVASGVARVERHDSTARIFVDRAAGVLTLLHQAIGPYENRVSVEITPPSLEALFLQLTGKELRD